MTSLSTWALMNIEGPTPAVMTLSPAKYSSATRESAGAVASRDGRSGIEKIDTAVLKFSTRSILVTSERKDRTKRMSTANSTSVQASRSSKQAGYESPMVAQQSWHSELVVVKGYQMGSTHGIE